MTNYFKPPLKILDSMMLKLDKLIVYLHNRQLGNG